MIRHWIVLTIFLMIALPSALCASWIKDKVYMQTEEVGKVEFSHYTHMTIKSVGRNCQACHNHVFHVVAKKNQDHTMSDMEDGKSCGFCHNGKKAFGVDGDCATCHAGEVAIQTQNVGSVNFSHTVHTDMFGCGECHPDLFKAASDGKHTTMKTMQDGESCGACHDGDTAFGVTEDCTTCHAGDIVYIDEDAGNITFPHGAHTEMYGCDDCHSDLFKPQRGANEVGMDAMEEGESCGACHDGSTAFNVAEDCESCHDM